VGGLNNLNVKLTIEFVRSEFAKKGCILLTKVYKNNRQKLEYICPEGKNHKISWDCWQRGHRCSCYSKNKKLNIEFIRAEFKKEGYELLTKVYDNAHQKLEYICSGPEKHRHSITWGCWQSGKKCPYCVGNAKLNIEFIRAEFAKEGYELLTEVYENAFQKLDYICPEGHSHFMIWNNWQQGRRCPDYAIKDISLRYRGSGNPGWKGGISKEPYCQEWTKELKESIKERDGYKCMNPYCFRKTGHAAVLIVHHIDGDKKNCRPENLIILCRSCHGMVSKDNEWHEAWYKAIIYRRYGYVYE
jgi:5-methylcytosine-specific restriction endonuclease McrA